MASHTAKFGDFLVFVPGIMGSRLWRDGKEVWGVSKGQLVRMLLSGGRNLRELSLPPGVEGPADDGITAAGLVGDIHVIPGLWSVQLGYDDVRRWFTEELSLTEVDAGPNPGNFLCFAYDWRLSNAWNALRLKEAVEPALHAWRRETGGNARLFLVCHSMGGLIGRYYAALLDDQRYTKALVTLGTPHRGAFKALSAIGEVRGWLARLGIRDVVANFPSLHELLPRYACLEGADGLETVGESTLDLRTSPRYLAATEFHHRMDNTADDAFEFYSFVGRGQDTYVTGRRVDGEFAARLDIDGEWRGGDGTVPEFAARPAAWSGRDYRLRGVHERHGSLVCNPWVRQEILRILTEDDRVFRAEPVRGIRVALAFDPDSRTMTVEAFTDPGRVLRVALDDDSVGSRGAGVMAESSRGRYRWLVSGLQDGAYVVTVSAVEGQTSVNSGVRVPLFILGGSLVT